VERDNLEIIYNKTYNIVRENAKYSWEMIKFYTLLCSSIITIIFTFFGILLSSDEFINYSGIQKFILLLIPIGLAVFVIKIISVGEDNFKRETKNGFEQLGILMKLEKRMGFLDEKRDDEERESLFNEDILFIPERWKTDWFFNSEKEFVNYMLNNEEGYYKNTTQIFHIIKSVSCITMIFDIIIMIFFCDP